MNTATAVTMALSGDYERAAGMFHCLAEACRLWDQEDAEEETEPVRDYLPVGLRENQESGPMGWAVAMVVLWMAACFVLWLRY